MPVPVALASRLSGLAIDLSERRVLSWRLLATVVAVEVVLSSIINLVVFPNPWAEAVVFTPIRTATAGVVTASLLVNLGNLAIVVVGLLVVVGGFRWRDLGLARSDLSTAVVVTVGIWLLVQCIGAVLSVRASGTVTWRPVWIEAGIGVTLGVLITQVFGNALYEELLFRAVLLDQLILKLRDYPSGFEAALVGSQLVFALLHVPNRLYRGYSLPQLGESLATLFLLGLLFAIVYHRTGNLLIAVGVHTLTNAPTMVVETPISGQFLVILLMAVLAVLWPLGRSLRRQGGI